LNHRKRRLDLAIKVQSKNVECVVINSPPNLNYFFNYSGQSFERFCCGLISKDGSRSALVIPKLDSEKGAKSQTDNIFTWDDNEGYRTALTKAASSIGLKSGQIGCESGLTLVAADQIREVLDANRPFFPVTDEISSLRLIKDQDEIRSIKKSASKLSRTFKEIPDAIEAGKTEAEVSLEIIKKLLGNDLKSMGFPLVQSGPNSAIPHSEAGPRQLRKGDLVVIDVSATNSEGYFADFTRSYVVGRSSAKQLEIFEKVKEAQTNAVKASTLGEEAERVDRAARGVIEKAGYAEFFTHQTGHGLGLEVHEPPFMKGGNKMKLEAGMVFTVEPGIYLPGKFGVRIEDNIVIGTEKSQDITSVPHELVEI
jgi:Xaa-Pro aminopeptidase